MNKAGCVCIGLNVVSTVRCLIRSGMTAFIQYRDMRQQVRGADLQVVGICCFEADVVKDP